LQYSFPRVWQTHVSFFAYKLLPSRYRLQTKTLGIYQPPPAVIGCNAACIRLSKSSIIER
jgi:hypothetical protein